MNQTAFQTIAFAVEEGGATRTLHRPPKKNAIDLIMRRELAQAVSAVRHDRSIRALMIMGTGGVFCAGGDIGTMQEGDGSAQVLHSLRISFWRHRRRAFACHSCAWDCARLR